MFNFYETETAKLNHLVTEGAKEAVSDKRIVEMEISRFVTSQKRKEMFDGEKYFRGKHDILTRQRTAIGADGQLEVLDNVPNNRIVDNQYKKMVNQKTNYLLGQPLVFRTDNIQYGECLKQIFNKRFMRLMKNMGKDSYNGGIGWMFIYYDENGEFNFTKFKPYEVIPFWKDADHTILEAAIRIYEVACYDKNNVERLIQKVEVYDDTGIRYFVNDGGLKPEEPFFKPYKNQGRRSLFF